MLTSWPGVRDDLVNAGATWLDQELVEDGNLLTSRGPQDMVPFVRGIIRHFAKDASLNRKTQASESSPQHDEPPQIVISAMKWLPKPSIRTALILGGLGAGLYAMRNRPPVKKLQKQFAKMAA